MDLYRSTNSKSQNNHIIFRWEIAGNTPHEPVSHKFKYYESKFTVNCLIEEKRFLISR